jgi:hypothetical protein
MDRTCRPNGYFRIPKESAAWKVPWKKTCGKTTTEMGRHHKVLLVAAEYKTKEGTSRGQGHLEAKCWRRQGPMRTLAAPKSKKTESREEKEEEKEEEADDDDFLEASDTRSKSPEILHLHLQFYIQQSIYFKHIHRQTMKFINKFFPRWCSLQCARASSLSRLHDHTQAHRTR